MRFKNYLNRYNKKNRIYSEEELLAMTLAELLDNESSILAQDYDIGIPDYEELKNSPNTRWIDSYINQHGQKDGGYYGSIQPNDILKLMQDKENMPMDSLLKIFGKNDVIVNMDDSPVLEGGIEENVYLPEEDAQDETILKDIPYDIPDEEPDDEPDDTDSEKKSRKKVRETLLGKLLEEIFMKNKQAPVEPSADFEDLSPSADYTNNSLPNILNQDYNEELQKIYEELLEELRKKLRAKYYKYSGLVQIQHYKKRAVK